jgi:hypothetical protein
MQPAPNGETLWLGIIAPREIPMLRSEIESTGEQNRIAAQAVTSQGVRECWTRFCGPPEGNWRHETNTWQDLAGGINP